MFADRVKAVAPTQRTPFYAYDTQLLNATLDAIKAEVEPRPNYHVHYAIKANNNADILRIIAAAGFGADCVSGGEVALALQAGFAPESIFFAGVGKSDEEICLALQAGIGMFNVESVEELEVINELATSMNTCAHVSFRINPDVSAHTHAHITTGRAENKFGIAKEQMTDVIRRAQTMQGIAVRGLHFHIGSQILDMGDFEALCLRINELQDELDRSGIQLTDINVGGGLGIDYECPNEHPITDFHAYFTTFTNNIKLRDGQHLHFELGRSVVAQMGSLIARVLYVKHGTAKQFVILDAGMTDLIRPALYGAVHKMENLSAIAPIPTPAEALPERATAVTYDVVGPICESSDVFARDYTLPETRRGDIIAIRSAGAYGETMASAYNARPLPPAVLLE